MKVCLAGEGAMGLNHIKALKEIQGVQVASLCGGIPRDAQSFAAKWQIPHWSRDLETCLDQPDIDAVLLATPSHLHAEQTVLALCKKKHVLVEIPMSLNLPDAERISRVAETSGHICMVAHTRRFSPPHAELRRRIREGTFHLHQLVVETYFFRRTNLNMFGEPRTWVDNLLWHHACHSVDLMYWLLGDPDLDVWGQKGPDHPELGIPMDMTIGMRSKEGQLFTMVLSFNNKGPFGGFYRYIGEEETYKVYRDTMTDGDGNEVPLDGPSAFEIQDREFIGAIRERRPPESGVASCLPAMRLLERIEKVMNARSREEVG